MTPDFASVLSPLGVEDRSARVDRQRRGHAQAQPHLFLVAERERLVGREGRVPKEQVALRPNQEGVASDLAADNASRPPAAT